MPRPLLRRKKGASIGALALALGAIFFSPISLRADEKKEPTLTRAKPHLSVSIPACVGRYAGIGNRPEDRPPQTTIPNRGTRGTVSVVGALAVNAAGVGAVLILGEGPKPEIQPFSIEPVPIIESWEKPKPALASGAGIQENDGKIEAKEDELKEKKEAPEDAPDGIEAFLASIEDMEIPDLQADEKYFQLLPGESEKQDSAAGASAAAAPPEPPKPPEPWPFASRAEQIREARAALEKWKETGKLDLKLGEFFFAAEVPPESKMRQGERERTLRSFADMKWDMKDFAEIMNSPGLSPLERIEKLRKEIFNRRISTYCRDLARLPNIYLDGCGNCESRTKLFTAALLDERASLGDPHVVGVQVYADHLEPVVIDRKEDNVYGLVDASIQSPPNSKIYHPAYLLHAFLEGAGEASPVTLKDLLLDGRFSRTVANPNSGSAIRTNTGLKPNSDPELPKRVDGTPPPFALSSYVDFDRKNAAALRSDYVGRHFAGDNSIYKGSDGYSEIKAVLSESSGGFSSYYKTIYSGADPTIRMQSQALVDQWNRSGTAARKQLHLTLELADLKRSSQSAALKESYKILEQGIHKVPAEKVAEALLTLNYYLSYITESSANTADVSRKDFFFENEGARVKKALEAFNKSLTEDIPSMVRGLEKDPEKFSSIFERMRLINYSLETLNSHLVLKEQEARSYSRVPPRLPLLDYRRSLQALVDPKQSAIVFPGKKVKKQPGPPPPPEPEVKLPEIKMVTEAEFQKIMEAYKKQVAVKNADAPIKISPEFYLRLLAERDFRKFQLPLNDRLKFLNRWDPRLTQLCTKVAGAEKGTKAYAWRDLCRLGIHEHIWVSGRVVNQKTDTIHRYAPGEIPANVLDVWNSADEYVTLSKIRYPSGYPRTEGGLREEYEGAIIPKEIYALFEAYGYKADVVRTQRPRK